MNEYHVPQRFRRPVVVHIIKNLAADHIGHVPLLLGIQGPSGEGKTFQCDLVLNEIEAEIFAISGGQLESKEAGEPAELLRLTYIRASRFMQDNSDRCAVVLMNDVDTGLGHWGDLVQYTVNRQTVFGELMHLADYPTLVEGRTTLRVPLILTGNNFQGLYSPLVRAGRMTCLIWEPAFEERVEIVARLFTELSRAEVLQLLKALTERARLLGFGPLPVAFFSHLRAAMVDDALWDAVEELGVREVVQRIRHGHTPDFSGRITGRDLADAGFKLMEKNKIINHLRSSDGDNLNNKLSEILYTLGPSQDPDAGGT